ncbi:hypothetical protein BU16DRAFT_527027 [Lophium mytilinum]|uniref:Uncharacterized protein n=1 Tax=Lophium mytilinum TaxID=390894 RepID=A0A6A6QTT9_9PEZI|nr:hypothetical protein BU16DRAFT_527027 [Lophium mytilinum]
MLGIGAVGSVALASPASRHGVMAAAPTPTPRHQASSAINARSALCGVRAGRWATRLAVG